MEKGEREKKEKREEQPKVGTPTEEKLSRRNIPNNKCVLLL